MERAGTVTRPRRRGARLWGRVCVCGGRQWVVGGAMLSASFPMAQAMIYVIVSKEVPRRSRPLRTSFPPLTNLSEVTSLPLHY